MESVSVALKHNPPGQHRQLFTRSRIFAFAFALVAFAAAWWYTAYQRNHSALLRVGFNEFAPYVMVNAAGKPEGLAVEMITRSAKAAKIPIEWVPISGDIDDALLTRRMDLYPLLTLTPQRRLQFHISQPWWENEIALISLEERPLRSALDTTGKRVAIRGMPIVKKLAETLYPDAKLVLIPRMEDLVPALCRGEVQGFFLDLRLLESQLLKGDSQCPGHGIHVSSIPNGSLSLATMANPAVSQTADRLYEAMAQLAADGTLSEIASSWSLYNHFESRHVKDAIDSQHRAAMMRYGLAGLAIVLALVSFQTHRIRRAQVAGEAARRLAEENQQRFDAFMRYMPAMAFIKTAEGRMSFVNQSFCDTFQTSKENAIGKLDRDFWSAEFADQFRDNYLSALSQKGSMEVLETSNEPNGAIRSYLSHEFPFTNSAGERFVGGIAIDVTERLRAEEALQLSQFSIDCADDTMLWIDEKGLIFSANRAACRDLEFERDDLIGLHISQIDILVDAREFERSRAELKQVGSLISESTYRRKDGATYPVEIRENFLAFQGKEYSCCVIRNITERKEAERELSRQALHDALTGLPNRRCLEAKLSQFIEQARSDGKVLGVMYLDLDGFKLVNDTLGHAIGDILLKKVAGRLQESLRDGDLLFRMGGDEFTLLLTNIPDQASVSLIAHKLLANLHESFSVEDNDLCITASIGISMFPDDGGDESVLLRNADAAMYESKREGKNRIQFFTPEMGEVAKERLELENQVRRALSRHEFSLHFQPEFCMSSGKILRHEALLRWTHPILGSVPPAKFIPIAEDTALIVPIGTWVLEQACRRASEWQHEARGVGVAVNVSILQFVRADFIDTVNEALRRSGLPPHLLELELTESVVMRNVEETVAKVGQLRKLGVSVSIDDFGTGYSSLSYLQRLPINSLKIDRSFIRDIAGNANAVSLTGALVSMAHSLGMTVVVEGVETPGQLAVIRQLGCDVGQGYFLGMPSAVPLVLEQSVAA